MAKNYVKPGEHIAFTAAANIASGQAVVIGNLVGVSLCAVASGDVGEAAIEGVWELPKLSTAVITAGLPVSWKTDDAQVELAATATDAGDINGFGVAIEAAGSGTTTCKVKLTPGLGTINAGT